jgi:hypothetical protein
MHVVAEVYVLPCLQSQLQPEVLPPPPEPPHLLHSHHIHMTRVQLAQGVDLTAGSNVGRVHQRKGMQGGVGAAPPGGEGATIKGYVAGEGGELG